jgi:hypothetical protein
MGIFIRIYSLAKVIKSGVTLTRSETLDVQISHKTELSLKYW